MAISQVSLSAAARANLTALQGTSKLLEATQAKLSSGKKVNSALDNASSFFASQGFLNSANDLDSLKDSMSTALQTIKSATDAIDSVTTVINQMKAIVNSALQTTDDTARASYSTQYDDLRGQLDDLANDATFNGTNLVNNITSNLTVNFNATNTTSLAIVAQDLTTDGMGVGTSVGSFATGVLSSATTKALSVDSIDNTLTAAVYAGDVTFNGSGATGPGAETAMDDTNGMSIASGGYTNGSAVTVAVQTSPSTTGLTAVGAAGAGTLDGSRVTGTFSVTANDAATGVYTDSTGGVAAGGVGAFTITIEAGDSAKFEYGNGTSVIQEYVNNTDTAITFTLATTAASTISSGTNSTTSYTAAGGTAVAADFDITVAGGSTLDGNDLVDSGDLAVGANINVYTTAAAASTAVVGTVNNGTVTAYDTGSSVVSAVTGQGTVTATKVGVGAISATNTSYTVAGAGITATAAKSLSGSSSTVTADSLATAQNQLSSALTTLRSAASGLGNNNTLVQTRLDFTTNLISTLSNASDALTLADTNEEGANLQALQAQSQLGIVALGISGDQAQAIMRLF